jgi:hypothetical protein
LASATTLAQGSGTDRLVPISPTQFSRLGAAVAIDGDTAVVASFREAFIFVRTPTEPRTWTHAATLPVVFSNPVVDISGSTIILGERLSGLVHIYERNHPSPNAWGMVTQLMPAVPSPGGGFGASVAIRGGTAVVGAIEAQFPGGPGSAYVFERNRGGQNAWGQVQQLRASDGQGGDQFGAAVAIDGSVILVGAPSDRFPGPNYSTLFGVGSAYVFIRDAGSDTWHESAKLTASDGGQSDAFGWSLRVEGSRAVIGVPGAQPQDQGAAYIFERQDGVWREVAKLQPHNTRQFILGENFGRSVALSGDVVVAGAPEDHETGPRFGARSGSAYVFRRDGEGRWNQVLKLTASDGVQGDVFGSTLALESSTLIVGAPTLSISSPGAAYVCQLDSVTSTSTGCRRQVPDVSGFVRMSGVTTACCDASQFVITATITNTSQAPIRGFFFEVGQLTDGNLLLNADDGPGGVRATLTPDTGDGMLSPGESVTTQFVIGLASQSPFSFWVYARGEPQP